ncbi:hypothetical protein V5O48_012617 [Marasmius crinis-equi]|uniref:Uncharacterized protein n=1 Tax=Marasmius crinis-equi TaxID=585013 RepID=A0ABR3F2A6_9AGAR
MSRDEDSRSEASSICSSSTVHGLGYLSGRAIKSLGEAVLNGLDYVLVTRQLGRMESYFAGQWNEENPETREMCRLLIEFAHPGYILSVRTRAMCLIMSQIGAGKFKGLAGALDDIESSSTYHRHLLEVWDCVNGIEDARDYLKTVPDNQEREVQARIVKHLSAAQQSYLSSLKDNDASNSKSESHPTVNQNARLIVYLAFIAAHNHADNAHILLQIDIISLLHSIGLFTASRKSAGVMAGRMFLYVLDSRLRSEPDSVHRRKIRESIQGLRSSRFWVRFYKYPARSTGVWRAFERSPAQEHMRTLILEFNGKLDTLLLGTEKSGKVREPIFH